MKVKMQKNGIDNSQLFMLFHIYEAIRELDNSRLQMLSRILITKLSDLKSIHDKVDLIDHNIRELGDAANPYLSSSEIVAIFKRRSSLEKKNILMLKHRRMIEMQILDAAKSVYKVVQSDPNLNGTDVEIFISKKLQEIQEHG